MCVCVCVLCVCVCVCVCVTLSFISKLFEHTLMMMIMMKWAAIIHSKYSGNREK